MANVYTRSLGRGTMAVGTNGVIYTVPAGIRTVVRAIETVLATGTSALHYLQVNGAVNAVILSVDTANPWKQWRGELVLDPGDTLTVFAITGGVFYHYSGWELTLP